MHASDSAPSLLAFKLPVAFGVKVEEVFQYHGADEPVG